MAGEKRGPAVDSSEDLYRAITRPDLWKAHLNQPSSAAFSWPCFSVDIVSRTTHKESLSRFDPGTGLVQFNCGAARQEGFNTRDEPDAKTPENKAHAHVYCDHNSSQRKKRARRLAEKLCQVVVPPSF